MKRNLLIETLCALICALRIRPLAANEEAENLLANASDGGSPFAILQSDGFVIPYGEFPHKQGLQVFDRDAAEGMVAAHNSLINRLMSWARGDKASYPVYIGHPDLPGSKDADKRAWGWIEGMSAENDGLHLSVKWSPAGRELVENAHYRFYSPLWYFKKLGGGKIRPVALKSMGLTNEPNIPVPALANEMDAPDGEDQETPPAADEPAEVEEQPEPTVETVVPKEILEALGLEEGDLTVVLTKLAELRDAADAKVEAETKATDAETARVEAENQLGTANTRVTDLEGRLRLAAGNAVQAAVLSGRIAPVDVEQRVNDLLAANDFEASLAELGKLAVKFKTTSATGNLGGAKSQLVTAANDEAASRRAERARLVANELERINPALPEPKRKSLAWSRAQTKHPELFSKGNTSSGAAA